MNLRTILEKMLIKLLPKHYQKKIESELILRNLNLIEFLKIAIGNYFVSKENRKKEYMG